ncbi:MAG: hypothetical protein H0X66_06010 [Verrucomicrobia bacterium]|nr:hypothetical protein [Verrucomicrobiota bacterium]
MKDKQQKLSFMRGLKFVAVFAILAATLTMSFAPELTKPLFLKYYRSVYATEAARTL